MRERELFLFKEYPNLKEVIPWIPLLRNTPTPIDNLNNLETHLNAKQGSIFIKRDDKNHHLYGGNKIRKFEFLFGKLLKKKRKSLIAIGGIGTNHGIASAIICKNFDPPIDLHLFLTPQPLTKLVQRNLLLMKHFNPKSMHYGKTYF